MTTPKVRTKTVEGRRHYILTDGRTVPGVTSVLQMLAKPALIGWAAKMAGLCAVNEQATWSTMPTDQARLYISGAHSRSSRAAANAGTDVHAVVERIANGEKFEVPEEAVPYVKQYLKWRKEFGAEALHVEATVLSKKHGYAGSIDGIYRLTKKADEIAIVDIKAGASGVWSEAALQQCAYMRADVILDRDGTETPLPKIDDTYALWLRPEGYAMTPLDHSEETFGAFLSCLDLLAWSMREGKTAVKTPINEHPLTK